MYWLSIYPVDVIKSAQATDALDPSKRKYPNMATTYKVLRCDESPFDAHAHHLLPMCLQPAHLCVSSLKSLKILEWPFRAC